eukprot:JZ552897.1.p1 GENE.JZ552897.1~~JZ552897.1.p1  ORF type:complete len:154 (-),score=33.47 JZ552897.1:118-579(-)
MGVGYGLDMLICVGLGVDMFDCVYPTRTGRFGTALTDDGVMHLKNAQYASDLRPIDGACTCRVCQTYTRASLHALVKDEVGMRLVTYHNIAYQLGLMGRARQAIIDGTFDRMLLEFIARQCPAGVPDWVKDACGAIGVDLAGLRPYTAQRNAD